MGSGVADNVHETGVSPRGQSRSPIVAAEAQQGEPTRTKTWSRVRSEVFVPYRRIMQVRRARRKTRRQVIWLARLASSMSTSTG
jgi:ADP-ribose pyrophosphatase YjhB (NUDIX family)